MRFPFVMSSIARSSTIRQAWSTAMDWFGGIGLSRAVYGYTRYRWQSAYGNPDDALFLTTESEAFVHEYFHSGIFAQTPGYKWAMTHTGMSSWKWISEALRQGTLTQAEIRAATFVRNLGVQGGVTISFPETSYRARGAIGLIGDAHLSEDDIEAVVTRCEDEIFAVAHMMHYRILQMPFEGSGRKLTERQQQTLEWVADGKTAQDIAFLMNVSVAMVDKHLRLARDALGAETTAQAVAKATLLNLIYHGADSFDPR